MRAVYRHGLTSSWADTESNIDYDKGLIRALLFEFAGVDPSGLIDDDVLT